MCVSVLVVIDTDTATQKQNNSLERSLGAGLLAVIATCLFSFNNFSHQSMWAYRESMVFKRVRLAQSSTFLLVCSHSLRTLNSVEMSKEQCWPSGLIDHTTTF